MRVAILGAGGMLGRDLLRALDGRHTAVPFTRAEADLTDAAALDRALSAAAPDAVINAGAATDVDRCEQDRDWAYRVNAWGAWNTARACRQFGVRLIHISTDFVFDGASARRYEEWDPPAPINVYGASKRAGEEAVLYSGARATVVRTQWLYGASGRSFPLAILRAARKRPEAGLRVVCDQIGAPTFTLDLAHKLVELLEWDADGVYHINNDGECSRAAWAESLLRETGMDYVPVRRIETAEWPTLARRPLYTTLRRYALELMGRDGMPPWDEGLRRYVAELRSAGSL